MTSSLWRHSIRWLRRWWNWNGLNKADLISQLGRVPQLRRRWLMWAQRWCHYNWWRHWFRHNRICIWLLRINNLLLSNCLSSWYKLDIVLSSMLIHHHNSRIFFIFTKFYLVGILKIIIIVRFNGFELWKPLILLWINPFFEYHFRREFWHLGPFWEYDDRVLRILDPVKSPKNRGKSRW